MIQKDSKIYIAGHRGMVGAALTRLFQENGYDSLILRTHSELDLTEPVAVENFFVKEKPEYVILTAAKVGGINANQTYPADFLEVNLRIQLNVISSAYRSGVKKLCFLGSSCIYPRDCPQPIKEEYLLSGPLETSNEAYALAKIAGYKMCLYYARQYGMDTVSLMPCNLYGPNDNFNLNTSHVLPALVRKFADAADSGAEEVTVWGSGKPLREFLHVDDLARGIMMVMEKWQSPEIINIGTGRETSIAELAKNIARIAGFKGKIVWDKSKPDGTPRKVIDVSKIFRMGFKPEISLEEGLKDTLAIYRAQRDAGMIRE